MARLHHASYGLISAFEIGNQPQFDKLRPPNSTCLGLYPYCKQQLPVPVKPQTYKHKTESKQNISHSKNANKQGQIKPELYQYFLLYQN